MAKKKIVRKASKNHFTFILLLVCFIILSLGGYLYFSSNKTVHTNLTFPNTASYPLGTIYYESWGNNLMKFDENTKKTTKLAHITDDWVKLALSKSKDFFYVLDSGSVWKMDLQGKKIAKLIDGSGKIKSYIVSPNENMIAYELSAVLNNDTVPTRTNQYVLNIKNNTVIPIPLYSLIEVNEKYNTGDVYMLSNWLDNETILKSTNGSPPFTWNMTTNSFGSDSPSVQMHNKWGSTSIHSSPNKKYQVVFKNNGIIVYDNKDNVVFDKYDYHKFAVVSYQGIGWTPDSRFYAFKMDRMYKADNTTIDAIGVIDMVNRKTFQYSLDLLPLSNKDVEMNLPTLNSGIIESGKIYFMVKPLSSAQKIKKTVTLQSWVFDISTASFKKMGEAKEKSDNDLGFSSFFWIK